MIINTSLFTPGTFIVVAAITLVVYTAGMRWLPAMFNGKPMKGYENDGK